MKNSKVIGVISPSSSIRPFPIRTRRAIDELKKLGYKVIESDNFMAGSGYFAGTAQDRAEDINRLCSNSEVQMILCSTGGLNSIEIIDNLDYPLIKRSGKSFIGSSDNTILLIALYTQTKIITFHGPSLLPDFGNFGGVNKDTLASFEKVHINMSGYVYPVSCPVCKEKLFWDKDDNRKPVYKLRSKVQSITNGFAKGKIIGGNLESLLSLAGTKYFPDFSKDNFILFVEETCSDTAILRRSLKQLELMGVLEKIKGFIYSEPVKIIDRSKQGIQDILFDFLNRYKIPVAYGYCFGHTSPILTVPIGARVEFTTSNKNTKLTIL